MGDSVEDTAGKEYAKVEDTEKSVMGESKEENIRVTEDSKTMLEDTKTKLEDTESESFDGEEAIHHRIEELCQLIEVV